MSLQVVGTNTVIYAIGGAVQRMWSFILIPLYVYAFPVDEYGLLSVLLVAIQILVVLTGTWIRDAYIRFAPEYESANQIDVLLGTSLVMIFAVGFVITTLATTLFTRFVAFIIHNSSAVHSYIVLCCGIAVVQSALQQMMAVFQGRNQAFRYMMTGVSSGVLLLAANLLFVKAIPLGVVGVLYAQLSAYGLALIVLAIVVCRQTGVRFSFLVVRRLLIFGGPLIVFLVSAYVMESASTYFLSYSAGNQEVAVYNVGYKCASIATVVLVLPFQLAFPPYIFAHAKTSDLELRVARSVTYYSLVAGYVVFGVLTASYVILRFLIPPVYSRSYAVIVILAPAFTLYGLSVVGQTLLHLHGKTYVSGAIALGVATFHLLWNAVLVPRYHMLGAAMSTGITFAAVGLTMLAAGGREVRFLFEGRRLVSTSAVLAVFTVSLLLLSGESIRLFAVGAGLVAVCVSAALLKLRFFDEFERRAIRSRVRKIDLGL